MSKPVLAFTFVGAAAVHVKKVHYSGIVFVGFRLALRSMTR